MRIWLTRYPRGRRHSTDNLTPLAGGRNADQRTGRRGERWDGLDLLTEHDTAPLPDTERVVNPASRELVKQRNRVRGKPTHRRAMFAALTLHPEPETLPRRFQSWLRNKAELLEEIQYYENQIEEIKAALRQTSRHLRWEQLPEEHQFHRLAPTRRRLIDTIRMIAYRAETAMASLRTGQHTDSSAARTILQDLFRTAADLVPEPARQRLRVRVHHAARPVTNRRLCRLFDLLDEAEIPYPGADLRLHFELLAANSAQPRIGVTSTSAR